MTKAAPDLWDRHGVKVPSHMVGEAVQRHPALAKEIVARGHEASGHGPRWSSQYAMSREAFLRKDEIARYALQSPLTLRESEAI